MCFHFVRQLDEMDRLSERWWQVHDADPHASVFSSWGWVRGWCEATANPWVMVVAGHEAHREPVAFLPLSLHWDPRRLWGATYRLVPAGFPFADEASLVCAPEHEHAALGTLAEGVTALVDRTGAGRMEVREAADPRWNELIDRLEGPRFPLRWEENTARPFIPLPDDWETYLKGSKKRKALLRRAEENGYFVTHTTGPTLERDTDRFLELHQLRLGEKPPAYLDMMRSLLRWSFRTECLYMITLWSEEGDPTAMNVAFLDPARKRFHAYNGGWDEWYRDASPRRVAELYSIRWAIEHGYRTYDFGRGGEPYKFGFGAEEGSNANAILVRRALSSVRRMAQRLPGAITQDQP